MAKELRHVTKEFKEKYRSIYKLALFFESRKRDMIKGKDPFGVKCPFCDHVMEETYFYHIGEFRLRLECPNFSCGYARNCWGYDDIMDCLFYIDKDILAKQKMVEDDELPF